MKKLLAFFVTTISLCGVALAGTLTPVNHHVQDDLGLTDGGYAKYGHFQDGWRKLAIADQFGDLKALGLTDGGYAKYGHFQDGLHKLAIADQFGDLKALGLTSGVKGGGAF